MKNPDPMARHTPMILKVEVACVELAKAELLELAAEADDDDDDMVLVTTAATIETIWTDVDGGEDSTGMAADSMMAAVQSETLEAKGEAVPPPLMVGVR